MTGQEKRILEGLKGKADFAQKELDKFMIKLGEAHCGKRLGWNVKFMDETIWPKPQLRWFVLSHFDIIDSPAGETIIRCYDDKGRFMCTTDQIIK